MAWTTPVVQGDDLFCLSAGYPLRKLIDTINERIDFAGITPPHNGKDYLSLSPGDDPTHTRFWNSFTNNGLDEATRFTCVDNWLLPPNLFALMDYYDDPDPSDPDNPDPPFLQIVSARNQLGLPVTVWWDGVSGPSNRMMRRKRYRRVANILGTATQDDNFNPAVAGQRALDPYGNRWLCIASGNWILDNGGPPDILDNTLPQPDHCIDIGTTYGGSPTIRPMGYVGYGSVQPGDILGPWVFEERRQLLSLMTTLADWV